MHALTKVLQLEDGKVSDSSSTSDSSSSDSSSSTSSEEEAMPEYVPNPSLPPPPEYPSDDEYGMPNPSLGPQSEVLTDDEYLAPPAPAAPCEESHERPAKCQRRQEREEEFWSLAESHQLIAELLEAAEQENARLRAQRWAWARKRCGGKSVLKCCGAVKHSLTRHVHMILASGGVELVYLW